MNILVFTAFSAFLFFCWRSKSFKILYLKKLLLPIISSIFIVCLLVFSSTAVNSAAKGLNLWLNVVFPSLFPFFVASELLNGTGFIRAIGILLEPIMRPLFNVPGCGSFAFAMGITSGYPVGAKITSSLRKEKLISKIEAERLLAFTNNSGPLFIAGAVAVGMFKKPELGLFLLLCHIASCITVGILFRFYGKGKRKGISHIAVNSVPGSRFTRFKAELFHSKNKSQKHFGILFGNAIKNSVMLLLCIGGFIILFSVIINILLDTGVISFITNIFAFFAKPLGIDKSIINSIVSGFFEITTGTNMVSSSNSAPLSHKLAAASFIIGWAGISVHSQVLSIISSTDISIKPYLMGKFVQGIFACTYTLIGIKISNEKFLKAEPSFLSLTPQNLTSWQNNFTNSCKYMIIAFAIFLIISIILITINFTLKILKKS